MTDLARSSLEERLRQQPEDFEALVLLGQVSWDQNQKEDSLSYFLKAAKVRGSGALGTSFMGPESEGGQPLLLPQSCQGKRFWCSWDKFHGTKIRRRTASLTSSRQPR
jgi:hypothetical protein